MRLLLALLMCIPFLAQAEGCPTKARHVGSKLVIQPCKIRIESKLSDGQPYRLILRESIYKRAAGDHPDDGGLWGIDGGYPWTYIAEFSLTVGTKQVWIPRKAFADLVNVNGMTISERSEGLVIYMSGGDAAGPFSAEFTVKGTRLVKRMVRMGEMPDENWEQTVFHNEL